MIILRSRATLALAIGMAVLPFMTSSQAAVASSTFEDLGRNIDRGLKSAGNEFNEGMRDGVSAGINDAENGNGFNIDCPRNGLLEPAYCGGYDKGYIDGYHSPR